MRRNLEGISLPPSLPPPVPLVVVATPRHATGATPGQHVVGDGIWARAQDLIRSPPSIDCNHGG